MRSQKKKFKLQRNRKLGGYNECEGSSHTLANSLVFFSIFGFWFFQTSIEHPLSVMNLYKQYPNHMRFLNTFQDISEVFVSHYLCSAHHKQNISTLQYIKLQENVSLKDFMKQFEKVVLQVESCSIDAILQIFKRNISPGKSFFESLAKKLPATMNDLLRRANKYSMLEDDVRATTQ